MICTDSWKRYFIIRWRGYKRIRIYPKSKYISRWIYIICYNRSVILRKMKIMN